MAIEKLHVIFPLAPKRIYEVDEAGEKKLVGWDVRVPAAAQIKK